MEKTLVSGVGAGLQRAAQAALAILPAREAGEAPEKRSEFWTLPGFCGEARIMTSFGELPIKALRLRDPLRTVEGTFVRVEWLDQVHLDEGFLHGMPDAHPVRIMQGALGRERPKQEMLVSPQQMIATGDTQFRREFRTARDLLGRPGIMRRPETVLTYYMFHCGAPATLMIEGVAVRVGA
jgi:Hint domain